MAVAWICSSSFPGSRAIYGDPSIIIHHNAQHDQLYMHIHGLGYSRLFYYMPLNSSISFEYSLPPSPLPLFSRINTDADIAMEESAGWPFKCVYANWKMTEDGTYLLHYGLSTRPQRTFRSLWEPFRTLPARVLWFPYFANVTIYFIVLCLAQYAYLAALRKRNEKRLLKGRCERCSYPTDTSGKCPECGMLNAPRACLMDAGA